MKLIRWGLSGQERPGLIDANGGYRDLSDHVADIGGENLDPTILKKLSTIDPDSLPEVPAGTRLGACVGQVRHFLAIGLNYADHASEAGMALPEEPIVFSKAPSCIGGAYDDIFIPPHFEKTDWEVEVAVVLSQRLYRASEEEAQRAVAGYCVCNDLSERAYQLERGGNWIKGKSSPSFGPLGPWLVTADEIPDINDLHIWLQVNDERVQDSNTNQMIFNVPKIISYLSQVMILEAGDTIATGTPPGVGMGMKPPRYLKHGDKVRCGIEGLGEQRQICKDYDSL